MMRPAEKISITMTPDQLRAVRESVEAGEYASTSEVLSDAVRLWQCRRQEDAERLKVIRARIRRSLDDPRPALGIEEVGQNLETLFARARSEDMATGSSSDHAAERDSRDATRPTAVGRGSKAREDDGRA